jgi:hypothetical protein
MISIRNLTKTNYDILIQVPIDVTMEEPWARVVGEEPNRYDVRRICASAHNIANDRVDKVVGRVPCAPNNMERMLERRH